MFSIAAASPRLTNIDKKTITRGFLDANIDNIADDVVAQFGSDAVVATLDWANISDSNQLSYSWRRALAKYPAAVMLWLSEANNWKIEAVIAASDLLDPNAIQTAPFLTTWIKYAEEISLLNVPREKNICFMTFILTIGFNNKEIEACKLVSLSFQDVYDAAALNELQYDSWRMLERHAPSVSWFRDWDKCERLRAALVNKFIENDWPVTFLKRSINRTDTYRQVVDYCKKTIQGKKLLKQLENSQ